MIHLVSHSRPLRFDALICYDLVLKSDRNIVQTNVRVWQGVEYGLLLSCVSAARNTAPAYTFLTDSPRHIWMDHESPTGGKPERIVGQDPQLPQGFYPVDTDPPTRFYPGDMLSVTCQYNSTTRDKVTHAGSTSKACACV